MKTFLIYSKKPLKLISSVKDISNLKFIKYGFRWLYIIDFINILYALKRNFIAIAMLLILTNYLFLEVVYLQIFFIIMIAFLAYAIEGFFLKNRKYQMVATIEAKNYNQAREIFLKEYIFHKREISSL